MKNLLSILLLFFTLKANAQITVTGTIKGQITDQVSGEPMSFATVHLVGTDPIIGTAADLDGKFMLADVPVGRYTIQFSFSGYETYQANELLVTSGKEVILNIPMKAAFDALDEVVITAGANKLGTVNELAGISARMLSVEEANRYAGGFDDPARLASSFAGVASGVQSNGIVVRGNNPGALLWRMEGVEISNPNHFADLASFGGGGLTALSSHMLANSDFLMGTFPAAYTNAVSGVFDLSMRSGNSDQREHTFQAGLIGIDVASEGPMGKRGSSYLFNYRYSTLGLVEPILPEDAGGTNYQDLAFKFKVPTQSAGTFNFWGLGLLDNSGQTIEEDPSKWKYESDQLEEDIQQFMGASGIKHVVYVGKSTFLESDVAFTSNGLSFTSDKMEENGEMNLDEKIENTNWNIVTQAKLNTQLRKKYILEVGLRSYFQKYDLLLQQRGNEITQTVVNDKGSSMLSSAYVTAHMRLSEKIKFQGGLNAQHFSLNGQTVLEPRASLEWQQGKQSFGVAYGLHSRIERLNYYLNRDESGIQQNKNLGMTRTHHFVGTYGLQVNENRRIKIEPYFQYLFDVPVIPGNSFSFINLKNDWFINEKLTNTGKGRNYGVDMTLEQFLTDGFYYLISGSIFKSEYLGGDGTWRGTEFDRGYVANVLFGKEWMVGASESNIFGINIRATYQGGQRFVPVDEAASMAAMEVIEDDFNAYSEQFADDLIVHFSTSFRKNKPNFSSVWTISLLNATRVAEFQEFEYNRQTNRIDQSTDALIIPNLGYKIEF